MSPALLIPRAVVDARAGIVNLGEMAVAEHVPVLVSARVIEPSHNVAPGIDPAGCREGRIGKVDCGEDSFVPQETMIDAVGIDEAANDIPPGVNAIGRGHRGVRNVNFCEAKVGSRQWRAEGQAEQGRF